MSARRYLISLFVVTLIGVGLFGVPSFSRNVPECVAASDWVKAHSAELPATADELLKFSPIYRKYIFDASTAGQKSRYVQELFGKSLQEMTLTEQQRTLIEESIAVATPSLYVAKEGDPLKVRAGEIALHASQLFSSEQLLQLSMYRNATRSTSGGWRLGALDRLMGHYFSGMKVYASDCICASSFWCSYVYCPSIEMAGGECYNPEELVCTPTSSGCGWFGTDPCTGACFCQLP